jgi:hypothetical protein
MFDKISHFADLPLGSTIIGFIYALLIGISGLMISIGYYERQCHKRNRNESPRGPLSIEAVYYVWLCWVLLIHYAVGIVANVVSWFSKQPNVVASCATFLSLCEVCKPSRSSLRD